MTTTIALEPVDRVEILTVVDNVVDLLLLSSEVAKRMSPAGPEGADVPPVEAPLVDSGGVAETPVAEHGLAFLVSVISGEQRRTILFDTGSSVGGLTHNLRALGVDPGEIETIVLSHGHFDHVMGLNGLARELQPLPPLVVHPDAWRRRRVAIPGRKPFELPATDEEKVRAAGFQVIEAREPRSLLDGGLLVTGEIERTTGFERGLPVQQALVDGEWQPDPLTRDDQALVAHLRDKGLVVITGCGHAGLINTARYARKLTGVDRVHAVVGGFHLATPAFEPLIPPTVEALNELGPQVIAPTHCTGWRAIHALAAAFPDAFVPGSVGTRYILQSEGG
jgi:7,8-dihydropterin-6-yl-methyl-4-(beta-D-ribofuranosyl)aminobenzene 5'-phosphate synthase